MDRSLRMGKMKIFVYHMNADEWETSIEENFNRQVARMTCCVHTKISLFHCHCPNELMSKVVMGAEIKVMHRISNMDFNSPKLTWLKPPLMPNLPAAKANTEPWILMRW